MPGAKGAAIQSCLAGAGRRCFETAVRDVLKSSLDVSILCHAFGRKTDSTFGLKLRTEAVSTHLESVYSIPEGGRCQEEEVEHTAYQPVRKSRGHLSSASWVDYTRCLVVDDGEEVEGRQAGATLPTFYGIAGFVLVCFPVVCGR